MATSIGLSIIFLPLVSFPLTITSQLHCSVSPRPECFHFGKLKLVWMSVLYPYQPRHIS